MNSYVIKDGKQLRCGYTTGSCAAAASKAAAWMLLTGEDMDHISIITPNKTCLDLSILEISKSPGTVSCAVRKDSGDDPDITNGTLIFSSVSLSPQKGIFIDGGEGVGRVTKPGLDQPVGAAAINSVPRRMITEALEEVCQTTDYDGGLSVIISVPEGKALAERTFNPRLGIIGGISILGTSGIVEPMSDRALTDTIFIELKQRKAEGAQYVVLTPGNYGLDFIRHNISVKPESVVMTSNFIGESLDFCRELEFRGVLLIGHIGKLVKTAGGMLNTHSRYGDCRMEILAAYAGASGLTPDKISQILDCVTCDEAVRIIKSNGCFEKTFTKLIRNVDRNLKNRIGDNIEIGTILFSKEYGVLGETNNAQQLLKRLSGD